MKIGIDLDNILFNTTEEYLKLYNKLTSSVVTMKEIVSYDFKKCLPHAYHKLLDKIWLMDELWDSIIPLCDSRHFVDELINEGHEIFIVTASSPSVIKRKFEMVKTYFPNIKEGNYIVIQNKQMLELDVLIDDFQDNLSGGRYKGVLFDYPWNKDFDPAGASIHRVYNWEQAYNKIKCIL